MQMVEIQGTELPFVVPDNENRSQIGKLSFGGSETRISLVWSSDRLTVELRGLSKCCCGPLTLSTEHREDDGEYIRSTYRCISCKTDFIVDTPKNQPVLVWGELVPPSVLKGVLSYGNELLSKTMDYSHEISAIEAWPDCADEEYNQFFEWFESWFEFNEVDMYESILYARAATDSLFSLIERFMEPQ